MASPFSGKAGRQAAMWGAGYLQQLQPQIIDALNQGKTGAEGYLFNGPDSAKGAITSGYGEALQNLGKYFPQAEASYKGAYDQFTPIAQKANAGYDMLSNALGLNGAEGRAAARGAFQEGPGYQWQMEQAQKNADRRAASMGILTSGNAQAASTELASNLANQEWGNWLGRLQPYQTQAGDIATKQAQALQGLGGLYSQQGQNLANLNIGQGNALANLYGKGADLEYGTGQNIANTISGIGGQIAQIGLQGMNAGQQAAQNRTSALMGGLQLGGQALGGMAGLGTGGGATVGGNFISSIFGKS